MYYNYYPYWWYCCKGDKGDKGDTGEQGEQGIQGEQGEQGAAGLSDAIYAGSYGEEFTSVGIIPIAEITATDPTTMSVSGNAVNIGVGSYLVTYGFTAKRTNAGEISMSLYMGGSAVANETIIEEESANDNLTAAKTIVIDTDTATTLQLYNNTAIDPQVVTYTGANLTVLKLT